MCIVRQNPAVVCQRDLNADKAHDISKQVISVKRQVINNLFNQMEMIRMELVEELEIQRAPVGSLCIFTVPM